MNSPAASAVILLTTLRAGSWLPLSCRRGASVLSAEGAAVGTVTEVITGEWARVCWSNGLVSEVHGSQLGEVADVDATLSALLGADFDADAAALSDGAARIYEIERTLATTTMPPVARLTLQRERGRLLAVVSS